MQKITPFLWFDTQTEEAVNLYTSVFNNARVKSLKRYPEVALNEHMKGMEGKVLTEVFELNGQQFMALDGGPVFKFTPAISFFVNCVSEEEIDVLWEKISQGGNVMMPLQRYPFSKKFGWTSDKYSVSWQFNIGQRNQKISPCLLFVQDKAGKAEEAMKFYTSLFDNSAIDTLVRYEAGDGDKEGYIKHAVFKLAGQEFMAMDSSLSHEFNFNEAISFLVNCETQEEVDRLWEKLSAVPESEQCGWLKDKYGVSWQIVPRALNELMNDPDPEKAGRVMQAMLKMKKIVIADLQKAYDEE